MSLPLSRRLVLNRWMLSLFGVSRFEELADLMRREEQEGLDEHNVHRFHHALVSGLPHGAVLTVDELLGYDQNIVRHTRTLNERRLTHGDEPISWTYFQYLALLFTEIYLDRYFRSPNALLQDLNAHIGRWNDGVDKADRVSPLDEDAEAWPQLNKISLWMATGSGKTLLMHANILQFRHYLEREGRTRDLNRILLLTPNEGLSQQHLREFEVAGIDAEIFDKDARGLFSGHAVEILEVTKLREEMGDTTVAVDAFEENNLVLVDEGHRGASSGGGGTWMSHRNALCARGFSFEYSATFGQAVKSNSGLAEAYARNVLFDYSYRYFHEDGFGKDYEILNLSVEIEEEHRETYLVAGLLGYFQQLLLFEEHTDAFRPHQIEKPLWVFVGSSVTKGLGKRDASDIVEILGFLERFVSDRPGSIARIDRVLNTGLVTESGQNLLAGRFGYLNTTGRTASEIYDETLRLLFHSPAGGRLYVENLKGADGEVALRIGADNEAFGVVNVGDDAKLVRLCEKKGLVTGDRDFGGSLFHEINDDHSPVNLLIGSKKFTEGWSSWRVSTMGLMNVGRTEGAQIIQLFGRGVRLRGYGTSLKRSGRATLPEGVDRPKHIGLLETLAIFGVHADYMAQFRDFLREEGLPANEDRVEIVLPVIRGLGVQKLKTVRLKKEIDGVSTEGGSAFKRLAPVPTVSGLDPDDPVTSFFQKHPVALNWYPKIQAMRSAGLGDEGVELERNQTWLSPRHLAFLDLDALLLELERFKADRGWSNLNVTRAGVRALLEDPSWYRVAIPEHALTFSSFDRVALWHEVALALLKKFVERFYSYRRRQWELPHLEYRELDENDPNLLGVRESAEDDGYYRILVDRSRAEIVKKLEELKKAIERGEMKSWEFQGLKAVWFGRHLYQPLLYLQSGSKLVEVSPTPLNKGEMEFVQDLRAYCDRHAEALEGRELYLLRNLSRGRGVGFFEAENFHPD
ncbi:MAG: DEAD/DEAH box helicase family protein, partial [Longimicrobiales bacterium]